MSNVSDRDAATTDPAKGPGGTGKGRAAREKLKTEAKAAFENAPADQGESEAKRKLRASLETIEARASEIRRWSQARTDAARDVVEDHPLTVAASAFGVGLLIGLLAARL